MPIDLEACPLAAIGMHFLSQKAAAEKTANPRAIAAPIQAYIAEKLHSGGITWDGLKEKRVPLTGLSLAEVLNKAKTKAIDTAQTVDETVRAQPVLSLALAGGAAGALAGGVTGATNAHSTSHRLGRIGRGIVAGGGAGLTLGSGSGLVYSGVRGKQAQSDEEPETKKAEDRPLSFNGLRFSRERLRPGRMSDTDLAQLREHIQQARNTEAPDLTSYAGLPFQYAPATTTAGALVGSRYLVPNRDLTGQDLTHMLSDPAYSGTLTPQQKELIQAAIKGPDAATKAEKIMATARGTGLGRLFAGPNTAGGQKLVDAAGNHVGFQAADGTRTFLPGHAVDYERELALKPLRDELERLKGQMPTSPQPTAQATDGATPVSSRLRPVRRERDTRVVSAPSDLQAKINEAQAKYDAAYATHGASPAGPTLGRSPGKIEEALAGVKNKIMDHLHGRTTGWSSPNNKPDIPRGLVADATRVVKAIPRAISGIPGAVGNALTSAYAGNIPFLPNRGTDHLLSGVVESAKSGPMKPGTPAPAARVHGLQDLTSPGMSHLRSPQSGGLPAGALPAGPNHVAVQGVDLVKNIRQHQASGKGIVRPRRAQNLGIMAAGMGVDALGGLAKYRSDVDRARQNATSMLDNYLGQAKAGK